MPQPSAYARDVRISPDQDDVSSGCHCGVRRYFIAFIDKDAVAQYTSQRLVLAGIGEKSTREAVPECCGKRTDAGDRDSEGGQGEEGNYWRRM